MRKWSVRELESIESDIHNASEGVKYDHALSPEYPSSLIDSEADCEWLAERIITRALHGVHLISRCDACPDESAVPVVVIMDEYGDDMGSPSTLVLSHLCRYHVNQF